MQLVRVGDRRTRVKVGLYPDLSLANAREKARDLLTEKPRKTPERSTQSGHAPEPGMPGRGRKSSGYGTITKYEIENR
jgi:hypothetical protein